MIRIAAIARFLLTIAVFVVMAGCSSPVGTENRRAFAIGWTELAGIKATVELPEVDRVEIYLLNVQGPITANSANSENGFPFRTGQETSYYPILQKKAVDGDQAAKLVDAWTSLSTCWGISGLCHEPLWGLRFFKGRKLVLETTVCFKCRNFYAPSPAGYVMCGFDTKDKAGKKLFDLLSQYLPDPQTNPKDSGATR